MFAIGRRITRNPTSLDHPTPGPGPGVWSFLIHSFIDGVFLYGCVLSHSVARMEVSALDGSDSSEEGSLPRFGRKTAVEVLQVGRLWLVDHVA